MRRDETMVNAYVPGAGDVPERDAALIARRAQVLGPAYRLFYETPFHPVRGDGVWLYDAEGRAHLDAYNNVASVGHCHPRVVAAMAAQAGKLATHTRYLGDGVIDYAERLLATFPPELAHVMFTCTGSEANDLALRLARERTGGTGLIVTENAYHGVTATMAEASPSLGPGVPLGAHVRRVAPPDPRRGGDAGAVFAAGVAAAIADLAAHGLRPAALLVDTVFSSDGVFADPVGFLAPAVETVRRAGGLFIADEVQPGFGRTGAGMWGFARHGVIPDMVSLGKPMGNGYPVAGLVMRPEVVADFGARARYFNTFGGNAVAMATANAVLSVIEDDGLVANARRIGAAFAADLRALPARFPQLGETRAAGLFLGTDIVDPATGAPDGARAARLVNALRAARVLISATGPMGHVLKIRPPLVFSMEHLGFFMQAFEQVLAQDLG